MASKLHTLSGTIAQLRKHYSPPVPLPASDAFALVLSENVAYLAPRARRQEAFRQLKNLIGT